MRIGDRWPAPRHLDGVEQKAVEIVDDHRESPCAD
jgi:hypothetical protein